MQIPDLKPASKAILVFAQSASRDAAAKKLPGSESVFEHLTRQTLLKARRTRLPVFHFDEGMQIGDSFGERLSRAVNSLFERGFENLVVIGNDSPDLTSALLCKAFCSLERGKPVLGPSADGGVYLIGLHKQHFEYEGFLNLPWRKEHLFTQMISWIQSRGVGQVTVLNCKMDLDNSRDFRNWHADSGHADRKLHGLISGLFSIGSAPGWTQAFGIPKDFYPSIHFNKGSPALSL